MKEVEKKGMNAQATRSAHKLNFIPFAFGKISLIGLEGKSLTPCREMLVSSVPPIKFLFFVLET